MDGNTGEVGDDDVTGGFFFPAFVDQVGDVADGLGVGFGQVCSAGFVLANELARPEHVDAIGGALQGFDGFFKGSDSPTGLAKNVEKLVPKGVGFGVLFFSTGPLAGEGDGSLLDFIPTDGRRGIPVWFVANENTKSNRLAGELK